MARSIAIVGGGSSGWMTASYLRKALNGVDITLVEAPHIKTIGVGEATFSTIKLFFDYLGLEEHDWMPACNATYKLAVKFVNWTRAGGHFYHPFQRYETIDGYNAAEWWLKLKRGQEAFDYACFTIPALCDTKRSPRYLNGRVFDDKVQGYFAGGERVPNAFLSEHSVQYPYAYHFDAALLADYLEGYATQRGVTKVEDEVIHVALREDGGISHLLTREHGAISADLFIDCSGFRGLLINQALGEPFLPFGDSLLNDRAVAVQVPVDTRTHGIDPYTTATALSAGWAWNTPLYGRNGTGYVYCSQFLSQEEAEAELRRHLGPAADHARANHIQMRTGRSRGSWVKNCVAIGLSSGFVEPLESTGIFFIQHGIEELVHHFPHGGIDEAVVRSYNRGVANAVDGICEFLILHYAASDRDDTPYWRAVRNDIRMPESLRESLELWKRRLPNAKNVNPAYHGFEAYSYSVMLLGLGHHPETHHPALDHLDDRKALAAFRALSERSEYLAATLPSQYEYLTHVRTHATRRDEPVVPATALYNDPGQLWRELVALNARV